jgi:hypothetical protein
VARLPSPHYLRPRAAGATDARRLVAGAAMLTALVQRRLTPRGRTRAAGFWVFERRSSSRDARHARLRRLALKRGAATARSPLDARSRLLRLFNRCWRPRFRERGHLPERIQPLGHGVGLCLLGPRLAFRWLGCTCGRASLSLRGLRFRLRRHGSPLSQLIEPRGEHRGLRLDRRDDCGFPLLCAPTAMLPRGIVRSQPQECVNVG